MIFYRNEIEYAVQDKGNNNKNNNSNQALSEIEKTVYALLIKDSSFTKEQLAVLSSKSVSTIKRALSTLKDKGLIERVGSDRYGYWEVR